jgi:superkiller protein 3
LKEVETQEAFLEAGRNFFELRKFDESLMSILKATKLNPNNSECFFWLGKIYIATNDEVRSKKCFEKCLNQNPQNVECISILSAIYRKNKDWDNNLQILENSVKSATGGAHQKSAFFQLGLHHLGQLNFDNAVTAFRNSLRYDSNNAECWEALADAYFARGSYNSSLKVFEKSVELNSQNTYAKLQIAKIKFVLQQYQESINDYERLLSQIPDYLPALKGIADSHFGRAHYLHENHRTGRARDHCQEALSFIEKAIRFESSFLCLWRLLGNIFDFIGTLPECHSHLTIPAAIICEEKSKKLCGDELLDLASKCYSRCLKINKENDFVWFDLVANYYRRSSATTARSDESKMEFIKLAYDGAKHLVKLKPSKWQNWNLLGIICASNEINNPGLAQHCFIKAVTLDKKTFTSWSNLGVFYLMRGDIKLANKAFSRAQQSDTAFLNAWIGQSWIAELIGDRDEAMDLFRHCTQLGFHHESSIGYPNFVCSILNEPNYASIPKYEYAIDKMHAISLALDNSQWHCLMESETTFEAWTYVGYLSRCQKLYKQAATAYEKAVEKCSGQEKDKCLTDLGFCYLKIDENQKAAKVFSEVKEASFQSSVGLALAFYKGSKIKIIFINLLFLISQLKTCKNVMRLIRKRLNGLQQVIMKRDSFLSLWLRWFTLFKVSKMQKWFFSNG